MSESKFFGKGQATMIDLLMLGLMISILLVSTIYFGSEAGRAQTAREDSVYAQSMMNALMNYNSTTYGATPPTYDNSANLPFAEALNLYFCKGGSLGTALPETAQIFLDKTIKPGYDYIFVAQCGGKTIYVWNKQSDVCADYITLSVFDFKLSCDINLKCKGEDKDGNEITIYQQPKIGIWPDWKEIPPASDPKCFTSQ